MSTISKERLEQLASGNAWVCVQDDEAAELARTALASLEAEPAIHRWRRVTVEPYGPYPWHYGNFIGFSKPVEGIEDEYYYPAPPAPVSVPDEDLLHMAASAIEDLLSSKDRSGAGVWADVPARLRRAAMLQGAAGNSPVIPDDVRRMDWLVSKTVDVREPMVYGSHSLFWSQTITDEEDDYHATKLREQIDAAMEAEQAAAPQQEVK